MLRKFLYLSLFAVLFTGLPALAQDGSNPVPPAPSSTTSLSLPVAEATSMPTQGLETLPPMNAQALADEEPIRLSPDGPAVINLDRDATTVIIGNPNHASAVMENPRMIMLMPGMPGATKIMALDREGKSILNRHVLVGSSKAEFMRINRVCAVGGSKSCAAQSVYYCPDKCYETTVNAGSGNISAGGAPTAGPAPMPDPAEMVPAQ